MTAKLLQIKVRDNTLDDIDELQNRMHAPSRSDAVRRSVEIAAALVKSIEKGAKIIIKNRDGSQKQIIITGLNSA